MPSANRDSSESPQKARLSYKDLPALMTLMTGDEKHTSSATSTLDVLWVLYDRILRVEPENPLLPDRDRFLLSKGHGPMAYYAVLAATPHRQLNVGVPRAEHRHYGTIEEHDAAHGLDVDGIRARIIDFLKPGRSQ